MEAVKYDVKTLEYTPTDAVMLNELAKQISTGETPMPEKQVLPGSQEVELRPAIIGHEIPAEVNNEVNSWVELEKPTTENCDCNSSNSDACDCDQSLFDKVKEKAKDNWKWLAVGGGALILGFILFKVFKK